MEKPRKSCVHKISILIRPGNNEVKKVEKGDKQVGHDGPISLTLIMLYIALLLEMWF